VFSAIRGKGTEDGRLISAHMSSSRLAAVRISPWASSHQAMEGGRANSKCWHATEIWQVRLTCDLNHVTFSGKTVMIGAHGPDIRAAVLEY
jgi:hypothetical protein